MNKKLKALKYIFYNAIGIFVFFVPVTLFEKNTILLDHIMRFFTATFKVAVPFYILAMMVFGVIITFFIKKDWNKSATGVFFTISKVVGLISGIFMVFNIGPSFLFAPDILPFLFDRLATPLSIVIPLGGMFITFIISYGLFEFMGILMDKVMRPIFNTPGSSSVDAVASFVGSYSIALLITNKVYTEGKYTLKEASIIATGFSTVSVTFMVVIANTLDMMSIWTFYFFTCLIITFIVTAITVRLYPIRRMDESYYNNSKYEEPLLHGNILKRAISAAFYSASQNKIPLHKLLISNLKDGFMIASGVVPSVLSIGLIGLLFSKYTPIFDYIGYIFLPFTKLLGFGENAFLVAKAVSTSIAEMFLPAILVTELDLATKYIVAVVCVSEILFLSASIPCILTTKISIKMHHILVIWAERVILSLILAKIVAILFIN